MRRNEGSRPPLTRQDKAVGVGIVALGLSSAAASFLEAKMGFSTREAIEIVSSPWLLGTMFEAFLQLFKRRR